MLNQALRGNAAIGRNMHLGDGFYPFSGNSLLISASAALQIPRSVIKPVTNLAGVTSKAKLAHGLVGGQIKTLVGPFWSSPWT